MLLAPARSLFFRTEPPGQDTARRNALEEKAAAAEIQIAKNHASLDTRLDGRDFLCGAFSAADIATFMVIHYALRNGGPPLENHANLSAWYFRLTERAAIAKVLSEIAAADRTLSYPVPVFRERS